MLLQYARAFVPALPPVLVHLSMLGGRRPRAKDTPRSPPPLHHKWFVLDIPKGFRLAPSLEHHLGKQAVLVCTRPPINTFCSLYSCWRRTGFLAAVSSVHQIGAFSEPITLPFQAADHERSRRQTWLRLPPLPYASREPSTRRMDSHGDTPHLLSRIF